MDRVRTDFSSAEARGFDITEYQELGDLAREGLEVLPYVDRLSRHLAACDLGRLDVVHHLDVDEGLRIKRWNPRAYGRANRISKPTAHVTVVVRARDIEAAPRRRGPIRKKAGARKKTAPRTKAES